MQQNGNTQWDLECTNISQVYFALHVILIIVVKVNNKAVILQLLVTYKATLIWVNIGSDNGLLPLSDPMFIYHQQRSVAFTWEQFH